MPKGYFLAIKIDNRNSNCHDWYDRKGAIYGYHENIDGKEGESADMQKVFGYIGLFTLVAMWWLGEVSYGFL